MITNIVTLVSASPVIAVAISSREYRFACFFSPAPRHCPTTGIMARLMVLPGMFAKVDTEFATALAAMALVPKVEVRLLTQSLPIWNIPFSSPEGMPMPKMRKIVSLWGRSSCQDCTRSGLDRLWFCTISQTAAITRPSSVASAAPITPIRKP